MADTRALTALRRLEVALARVEAAASGPFSSPRSGEDEQLRLAHDRLRLRVGMAIGQIDHLLQSGPKS